jgi:hypothetical protein
MCLPKVFIKSKNTEFVAWGKKTKFILINNGNKIVDEFIVDDLLIESKNKRRKM